MMRIFALARQIRSAHFDHFVGLHTLVASLVDSVGRLSWCMLLIFAQLFCAATSLTRIVTNHKISVGDDVMQDQWELEEYYGSLSRAMLSLYETQTDGIHWTEIMNP